MEEYYIIDLPGGELSPAVLSEKEMQKEQLNIVEKRYKQSECKLVNVATQKSLSKSYQRSEGM